MKILLLNPAVDFDKQFGTLDKFYTPIPSLGLAYIGAVLRENGFNVVGQDSFMACDEVAAMLQKIIAARADVVAISLLTPAAPLVDRLVPALRESNPNIVIVMGNIHASVFHEYYLKERLADYIIHHEGEASMLELMQALRDGKDVSGIKGISYRNFNGAVIKTGKREWIDKLDLNTMPYPAWDLFPVEMFRPDIRLQGRTKVATSAHVQALPILASRGCPNQCTFCSPVNTIGRRYFMRTPESVIDEMEHFYKKWGVTTFYYMDLTFPLSEKLGIEFCDKLIERKLPIQWMCETRVSSVNYTLLKRMKEAGCARIDFGIECGNQKMLDSIKKGFTIQQVKDAVAAANKAGIETEGLFIIGLPDETLQDTLDTINFSLSLNLDHIKLNIFVPYPGSELYDSLNKTGELLTFNFDQYTSYPTYNAGAMAYVPKGRTAKELMNFQKIGMRKAMFRRKVILRELSHFKLDKLDQYFAAFKALIYPPSKDTTVDRLKAEKSILENVRC
ncbi:MAG: radical SAM protein [Candidatus Omnitrophica bacterium]|nr:radical SAM protein [Candidatus Omnitrophota bacterium]